MQLREPHGFMVYLCTVNMPQAIAGNGVYYVIQATSDNANALVALPGRSAAQSCVVLFGQEETARRFCRTYPDAKPTWNVLAVALTDLAPILRKLEGRGRTHVMIDPQFSGTAISNAGILTVQQLIEAIA